MDTVSWSEIQKWCTCRKQWYWNYFIGIVPKKVVWAPSVGSCGHAAVASILRGEDWRKAVEAWFTKEIAKRDMFDEEIEEYQQVVQMVKGIISRYLERYQDTWEPVAVEEKFDIGISGVKLRLIGYWDAVVKGEDGHLWLLEHKFPKQFRTEDQLLLDGQIGVYQYAAHKSGYPVVGTVYNQLLARLPAVPNVNKGGSVSRSKIYTDWETYKATVEQQGLNPADYEEMQEKLADFEFFKRLYIYRSETEIKEFARDMERRIWDMRKTKKHIYRSESYIVCSKCSYKDLCLEELKGGDVDYLIEMNFEPKTQREEEEYDREEDVQNTG